MAYNKKKVARKIKRATKKIAKATKIQKANQGPGKRAGAARTSAVSGEETARISADNVLDGKIDDEIANRAAAISAEVTARNNAITNELIPLSIASAPKDGPIISDWIISAAAGSLPARSTFARSVASLTVN